MPEFLLATRNAGKLRELRRLLAGSDWQIRGLDDFPDVPEAIEDGATFAANAAKKALYYAAAVGLPALADDSGLEVDALQGAPGVQSARYAGLSSDAAANNRKLIMELRNVPTRARAARFRCALAFAEGGTVRHRTEGVVEGVIVDEPRGAGGFGYDPHFRLRERDCTMAELAADEKNAISHRGQAFRAMIALRTAPERAARE